MTFEELLEEQQKEILKLYKDWPSFGIPDLEKRYYFALEPNQISDEIISDGHGGFTTKKETESEQCITTCDIKNKEE